jgi:RNA recognition motif-containing protein
MIIFIHHSLKPECKRKIQESRKKKLASLDIEEVSSSKKAKLEENEPELLSTLSSLISRQKIIEHQLPFEQLQSLSVMKNYTPGDPNVTLYIKNLPKKISEADLRNIFGNYCDDPIHSEV